MNSALMMSSDSTHAANVIPSATTLTDSRCEFFSEPETVDTGWPKKISHSRIIKTSH